MEKIVVFPEVTDPRVRKSLDRLDKNMKKPKSYNCFICQREVDFEDLWFLKKSGRGEMGLCLKCFLAESSSAKKNSLIIENS